MAINFIPAFKGKCTRYVKVDLAKKGDIMDYFQVGKVFNWTNFTIATKNDAQGNPPKATKDWNICFHIYGYNCKTLKTVKAKNLEDAYSTVIFRPNSQFMVCKVAREGSQLEVWIR